MSPTGSASPSRPGCVWEEKRQSPVLPQGSDRPLGGAVAAAAAAEALRADSSVVSR